MRKQGRLTAILAMVCLFMLTGCIGSIWTGATMIYDRHGLYKKVNDFKIMKHIRQALYADKKLRCRVCSVEVAKFSNKILLTGHVPTEALKEMAFSRVTSVSENNRVYNHLHVVPEPSGMAEDTWITTKIRMQVLADSSIDPNSFKVITSNRVVYLLGEMRKDEGKKLIDIARNTAGVVKVVTMLQYFAYVSE